MPVNPFGLEADVYVPTEEGYFVSETHARIAEIINEYDPELRLAWIPPERREPGDQPFAIIHSPLGRPEYVVCYSDVLDESLLARVFSMDATKNDVWSDIQASQAAAEALKLKKQMEEMEEANDLAASIVRSKKHVYRHDGVVYQ
jgi:hypothetical protein